MGLIKVGPLLFKRATTSLGNEDEFMSEDTVNIEKQNGRRASNFILSDFNL